MAEALPGQDAVQLPKEVIERLRYTVFGFDTFWVTSVDNYDQDGVVFKGNVRGRDPAAAFEKMKQRMKVRRPAARDSRPRPRRPTTWPSTPPLPGGPAGGSGARRAPCIPPSYERGDRAGRALT